MRYFVLISLILMSSVTVVSADLAETNISLIKLKKEIKDIMEKETVYIKDASDITNKIRKMVEDYNESEKNLNDINGFGQIEQLKVKAERYGFERQLRKNISSEVSKIGDIIKKLKMTKKDISILGQQILYKEALMKSETKKVGGEKSSRTLKEEEFRYYTVEKEGTLKEISALPSVYGDESQWKKLYNVNKNTLKIKNDESIISVGTELIIPNEEIIQEFEDL